jgi:DNA-binding protein H-NS
MESMGNNIMLRDFQLLLKECMENEKISKSIILKKRINYIYSELKSNPICFYRHMGEFEYTSKKIKSSLAQISGSVNEDIEEICIMQIRRCINYLARLFSSNVDNNSENYYSQQINELKEKESALNKEIEDLKQKNAKHKEKENELEGIKEQIKQYEIEKDELKKKLDARDNIKGKISDAFKELKTHISHLETEKTRLNWMFYIYAFLCVAVLVALIVFEWKYISNWEDADKWMDYLPFYIPVPIVGGLLWVFISQMNRAQRQLIQVANVLHHIDYVEGLLLAINHISTNVNSASDKICHVLDHLIKNHMSSPDGLSEQSLDAEISKDNINLNTFLNLAKEVKEVIK